jgi:TRAP-type uncharacterized transport system substrate-binding protein
MAGSLALRAAGALLVILLATAVAPARASDTQSSTDVIHVETDSSAGITVRLAEDMASLVDDGATRRIIPLVGQGGLQNVADLVQMPGIDMAILQLDVLDYARAQKLFPGLETDATYIAKLNYVEFHLLARRDVVSIADLGAQSISIGPRGGNSAITAAQLFGLLKLSPTLNYDDPDIAIGKLRRGEIGAVAFVGGKPAPLLRLASADGLHLLPIPMTAAVVGTYVPTRLSATDYPGLVSPDAPVETIAVGTGLFVGPLVAGSDAYRKVANVVDTLFTQFQTLLAPGHHGKWAEVNLSSEIPGWHRFAPADDWLKRNASIVAGQDLRAIFMRFLDEHSRASAGPQMSQTQKDALFDQFRQWQAGQGNPAGESSPGNAGGQSNPSR